MQTGFVRIIRKNILTQATSLWWIKYTPENQFYML